MPEPLFGIDHITFGTYWQHVSHIVLSMSLVSYTQEKWPTFLAANYTPRWSIFIISLVVVGLFHGISPFSPKSSDGPELGHFRNDVEEIRLPVPVRPRFFPIPFILSHFARGKK